MKGNSMNDLIFFLSLQFTLVEVRWALQNLTTARVVTAAGKITVFVVDIDTDQMLFRVYPFLACNYLNLKFFCLTCPRVKIIWGWGSTALVALCEGPMVMLWFGGPPVWHQRWFGRGGKESVRSVKWYMYE
jgi:hypothetical protein